MSEQYIDKIERVALEICLTRRHQSGSPRITMGVRTKQILLREFPVAMPEPGCEGCGHDGETRQEFLYLIGRYIEVPCSACQTCPRFPRTDHYTPKAKEEGDGR